MRRMIIHAVAAGAAVICLAQSASPVSASDGDLGATLPDDHAPAPLVATQPTPEFTPVNDETPSFVWSSDPQLVAPPYLSTAMESSSVPPSASATAIPLPAAAWTGFASLAGLGTIAFFRHLSRARH